MADRERIILVGGGGHARSVADCIARSKQYEIAGYIERDGAERTDSLGYPILGTDRDLKAIFDAGIHVAFVAIGYLGEDDIREGVYAVSYTHLRAHET